MRHRPRTALGQRFPLSQMDHQDALFEYCYILTLPECLLRTILKYLDVLGLIRLAATSKAFKVMSLARPIGIDTMYSPGSRGLTW